MKVHSRFRKGAYNVICDQRGKKTKSTKCELQWNNLFVCSRYFERRQPQDFVRGLKDDQAVPIARPRHQRKFLKVGEITPEDL